MSNALAAAGATPRRRPRRPAGIPLRFPALATMLAMTGLASGRRAINLGNVFPTPRPAGKATLPAGRWGLIVRDAAAAAETAAAETAARYASQTMVNASGTAIAAAVSAILPASAIPPAGMLPRMTRL